MATTSDIGETTISDLPPEVLSHIFTYLPNNLKVVRLVCSKWNESCNVEKVSRKERFDIDAQFMEPERVDEFFSSRILLRNIYNLSLDSITFKTDYVPFFEKFGSQLRSLTLALCAADEYAPFLQFCTNLEILTLDNCFPTIAQSFRCADGSFVQTNIVSLEIANCGVIDATMDEEMADYTPWFDETMDACIRICPHLRCLTLASLNLSSLPPDENGFYSFGDGEERAFNRSDILSFDCIYHALSIRAANIVELNLDHVHGLLPVQVEQIASIPALKLQKLELYIMHGLSRKHVCNVVTRQPNLQKLTIRYLEQLLFHESVDWIEKCSKLTALGIRTPYPFVSKLDGEVLEALTSRLQLRELALILNRPSIVRNSLVNSRDTFDHLRTLKLIIPNIDYNWILAKVTVNLNHLNIGGPHGLSFETLTFISNRFTNLEVLNFSLRGRTQLSYEYSQISFGSFEKLKTLHITVPSLRRCLPDFFDLLKAPNLSFLGLGGSDHHDDGYDKMKITLLRALVRSYPLLETFVLNKIKFDMHPSDTRVMNDWTRLNKLFYYNKSGYSVEYGEYLRLHQRRENDDKFDSFLHSSAFI